SCRSSVKVHPFVVGYVVGGIATGAYIGSFEDWKAVATCAALVGGNALVSGLICWAGPGLRAPWGQLWPIAVVVIPLMGAGIALPTDEWECLTRVSTGWGCMLAFLGPLAIEACVPPPLVGLAARWLWRRRQA